MKRKINKDRIVIKYLTCIYHNLTRYCNIYTKRNVADVMTLEKRNESSNVFCELATVQSCFVIEHCYLVEY